MKSIIIAAAVGLMISASGYAGLHLADIRYVKNDSYQAGEVRKLQYQVDELKWTAGQRTLTPKESWQLKTLESQLEAAKKK